MKKPMPKTNHKQTTPLRITEATLFILLIAALCTSATSAAAYNDSITTWKNTSEPLTIILKKDITSSETNPNNPGILVAGNITITPAKDTNNITINANQTGRLFNVDGTQASLTIAGNGTANLTLTGGKLTGKSKTDQGGAILVNTAANLTLEKGANIIACNAYYGGGIANYGTFTLSGANITNCNAIGNGGGVYTNTGTFTIKDGHITACTAPYGGGGIYANAGTLTMNGGTITACTATENSGGGVFISGNTFTMSGANITNCSATCFEGGGIFININGKCTMKNSNITACRSEDGGGIYNNGKITIESSTITKCTATNGGGIYISTSGTINISGATTITGNTETDKKTANNLYLNKNNKLNLTGNFTGCIGIVNINGKAPKAGEPFGTAHTSASGAEHFIADTDKTLHGNINETNTLIWTQQLNPYIEVNTYDELASNITAWTKTGKMRTIILTNNATGAYKSTATGPNNAGIKVTGNITIRPAKNAGDITIDANKTGRLFNIANSANLKLAGNGTANLNLIGGKLTDFAIAGSGGAILVNTGANLTLEKGANITNCNVNINGGGIYIDIGGTFTLNGANITNCTANGNGGGVCNGGRFTMKSGSITECSARYGGGVGNSYGTFTMENGNITACKAGTIGGGGIYVNPNSTFTMKGGNITTCKANTIGGGVLNEGTFNVSGTATITKNTNTNGSANNVALTTNNQLNLIDNFTGTIGIVSVNRAIPAKGEPFGTATGKYTGAENIFADTNKNIIGNQTIDNVLKWVAKPLFAYVEVNTYDELASNVTAWKKTDKMRTIVLTSNATGAYKSTAVGTNKPGIQVNGNITITPAQNKGEITIDANQTSRLFEVKYGAHLRLAGNTSANLTLTNGRMTGWYPLDSGGAIYINTGANATLASGANITNCSATIYGNGGSVYVNTGGTFIIDGGNITACSATNGGGVYNKGTLTIRSGSITTCSAINNGGCVYNRGTLTIKGGLITNCSATKYGSGIYNEGTFTISNKAFIDKNNAVTLVSNKGAYPNITVGGSFAGENYGAFNITFYNASATSTDLMLWIGKTIINGGVGTEAHFKLSPTLSGYKLAAKTNDLILLAEHTITYELYGGQNDPANPATYNFTTPTITLKNATKDNNTFEGWYTKATFDKKFRINTIVSGSVGNKTFYAHWVPAEITVSSNSISFGTIDLKEGTPSIPPQTLTVTNNRENATTITLSNSSVFTISPLPSIPSLSSATLTIGVQKSALETTGDHVAYVTIDDAGYQQIVKLAISIVNTTTVDNQTTVIPKVPEIEVIADESGKVTNITVAKSNVILTKSEGELYTAVIANTPKNTTMVNLIITNVKNTSTGDKQKLDLSENSTVTASYPEAIADVSQKEKKTGSFQINISLKNVTRNLPTITGEFNTTVSNVVKRQQYTPLSMVSSINTNIDELNEQIKQVTITFTIPASSAKVPANLRVIHVKNGVSEHVHEAPWVKSGDYYIITVKSNDGFSSYVVGEQIQTPKPSPGGGGGEGSSYIKPPTVTPTPTATPTATPTQTPTTATPTQTAQPTQTAASPMPFIGILAGLAGATALIGIRRR